jgi:hypothetical protein
MYGGAAEEAIKSRHGDRPEKLEMGSRKQESIGALWQGGRGVGESGVNDDGQGRQQDQLKKTEIQEQKKTLAKTGLLGGGGFSIAVNCCSSLFHRA